MTGFSTRNKLYLPEGIEIFRFTIKQSRNSFFSKLSELASTQLNVEITQLPQTSNYVVFAYSYGRNLDKYISDLLKTNLVFRSKIRRIKYWQNGSLYYIVAIKSKCEFLKLAEDHQIAILSPYFFGSGARQYIAIGEESNMKNYIDHLIKYYGPNNVEFSRVETVNQINKLLLRRSLLSILFDKLTSNELEVLRLAYRSGYFDYPRRSYLENLGTELNLSKVTVSIHIRKILKKIFDELMQFVEAD